MSALLFTRTELRELPASDLADLLRLAAPPDSDNQPWAGAQVLGLDPSNPNDRRAVEAAWHVAGYEPDPYSPPIGSDSEGVRSDLTPAVPEETTGPLVPPDQHFEDLGTLSPSLDAAQDLAAMMDQSVVTGEPFMAGTFAMYATPDGSIVMVTEGIGDGIRRSVVPRKWVRAGLGLLAGEGGGMKGRMLAKLFGG